jgi:hypothetical protein
MSLTQFILREPLPIAGFLPTWGGAVLRRHLGQFGVSVYIRTSYGADLTMDCLMNPASARFNLRRIHP